jgi:integrase
MVRRSAGPTVRIPRPFIPAVEEFKGRRLYLLRHGHKAWLDEHGHNRYAVEARMGHELGGVEGTYSSVTVAMERAIMKTLQERWEGLQERPALDHLPIVSQ